jgi:5'-3' exoribonuclease 1
MTQPSSPLAPYYPNDFDSDPNGKRQPWEAVVKIPFINGDQLLEVVNAILDADEKAVSGELLSNAERRRNLKGQSHTFVPERDPGYVAPSNKGRSSATEYSAKKRSTNKGAGRSRAGAVE